MKRFLTMAVLALMMVLGSSLRNTAAAQYDDQYSRGDRDVSYQTFYDELSPYGRWVDYPGVGYVWVPDAGDDFRPYSSNGHWVWTDDYEWMWVSEYDWGWAPFHYGRWDEDPTYGWYWVPGYEWSPAWVAWRDGGDYYGWAPIRPGINININFNIGGYSPPNDFWCFAPRRYITSPRIYDYCLDRRQNITVINYTTIIVNNFRYNSNYGFRSGPRRYDAERYCGSISPVRFLASNRPGRADFRNNQVSIYRPNVRRDDNRSYTPRNVERYDRNSTGGFRKNDNDNRTVGNNRVNNGNDDTRRFERNGNTTNQPTRNNDGRVFRPADTPDRTPNNGNNNGNNRRFERRDDNTGNTNIPVRQPDTRRNEGNIPVTRNGDGRVFQPSGTPDRIPNTGNENGNNRRFERRDDNNGNSNFPQRQPQVDRRQESRPVTQPIERRQESRPVTQPMERRQEAPRQLERRDDGGGRQNNGNSNTENRNGRRRF